MNGLITRSLLTNTPVEMIYQANNGTITQRVVTIQKVNGNDMLGYCHYRKKTRLFKINNILSLAPFTRKKAM
ncbi:hypothetical protein [Bacillus alkalicellulosilyticus]|uniref:hypothetical protein n=1 Tax=Alkalihalobacterium alkalicellulosilyticum TaxID=1912214 RepID=UPI000997D436|nr:hypothetical protein [Bacillus alkalicellulosilyticus]